MRTVIAVVIAFAATTVEAGEGRYLSVSGQNSRGFSGVWVTDTKTGKVRFCMAFTENMYESDHVKTTPRCTKWSDD